MRSNQWYILGLAFLILGMFFIQQDLFWGLSCKFDSELSTQTLIACIQGEMYEPFIWSFHVLWIVCWINGWIESRVERRIK